MKTTMKRTGRANVIFVAGSSPELRQRWKQGLAGKYTYEVPDRRELERSLTNLKPAVLVLDLAMDFVEGLESVSALQELSPSTKIMLLTEKTSPDEGLRALKIGARGYCRRDIEPSLLEKAVGMVEEGQIWLERAVIPYLLNELAARGRSTGAPLDVTSDDDPLEGLTPRECAVAHLIADGAWNKEIAHRLGISEVTVKAHLTAIYRKLGVKDRLQLGLFLARHVRYFNDWSPMPPAESVPEDVESGDQRIEQLV